MKLIDQIINLFIFISVVAVVGIFSYGFFFKKSDLTEVQNYKSDQSSMKDEIKLTDKYMQELNQKLKSQELSALQQMLKNQKEAEQNAKMPKEKFEDWTQSNPEKQIQKNEINREISVSNSNEVVFRNKPKELNSFQGVIINKDNAKEFITTARKNGYHIELSENFEILSVTPIADLQRKKIDDTFDSSPAQ